MESKNGNKGKTVGVVNTPETMTVPAETITMESVKRYKIDANKITSVDDIVQIIKRLDMYVDEKGVKGMEHLIADGQL